jgi:hypothetical protein
MLAKYKEALSEDKKVILIIIGVCSVINTSTLKRCPFYFQDKYPGSLKDLDVVQESREGEILTTRHFCVRSRDA